MAAHARFSPSGAHRWMRCTASLALCETVPRRSSVYADEGTAAHAVATQILQEELYANSAAALVGTTVRVDDTDWVVTEEMVTHGLAFADLVRGYLGKGVRAFADIKVDISPALAVPDQFGTADAIIVADERLVVIDYKYGVGEEVDVEDNEQLQLYALGALHEMDALGPFRVVDMIIHQPRTRGTNPIRRWTIPVADLLEFRDRARQIAADILEDSTSFDPGEKQCRFCDAKPVCAAHKAVVLEAVSPHGAATADEFEDLPETLPESYVSRTADPDWVASAMSRVDMIEAWCKAIRAETERRLFAGEEVPGYKLVEGRKGDRKWADTAAVEATFKSMRVKRNVAYDLTLISPTKAEKVFKNSPQRWARLAEQITRADGKPSVAPASDKRPAWAVAATAADFED
jgi:hypothetical protein